MDQETEASWRGKRVFITGATGLLGSHLTRALAHKGADVVAVVRDEQPRSLFYSNDPAWRLENKVTRVYGDIMDYEFVKRAINEYEIDTVFHLAAQTIVGTALRSPRATFKTNIEGTWNLLEACRHHASHISRIIVASSDKAYGNMSGHAYDETDPLEGRFPYDVSKSCADLVAQSYYHTYGLPIAITRCGNFFGPGDLNFNRLIPGAIRDILGGIAPTIRSNGHFIRDYLYIEDGVHAYLSLAQAMKPATHRGSMTRHAGEAFNFSYGLRLSALQVVQSILHLLKQTNLKPNILDIAKAEIPEQSLDSSKARAYLKWQPNYGFDNGLKKTIDWYRILCGSASSTAPT